MKITIKIKLDSGKEIELNEQEYQELQLKIGKVTNDPYCIPHVPYPWPNYPNYPEYPWFQITCSDGAEL